ncbi:hypothetical protein EON79_11100, partial [bacterium]
SLDETGRALQNTQVPAAAPAQPAYEPMTEDGVESMIALAERLRASSGGALDESAIQAVAEATGAPVDYVRLAVKLRVDRQPRNPLASAMAQYHTLEPNVRRFVISGVAATGVALLMAVEARLGSRVSEYGIIGMLAIVGLTLGTYNVSVSRDARVAAVAGAILCGGWFAARAVFSFALRLPEHYPPFLLIPYILVGALAGFVLQKLVTQNRQKLGLKDPAKERQEMLTQLVQLQERLRSGEKSITFLSVDIVGSTRMKENSDPLSVEFTFNEYHQFVDRVTRRYGGRVHSTAGDGVTAAFDHPQQAFAAAKNIQTGILEVNTFRNKIGVPIVLRCGIHTGAVVTPDADDIKSVNFSHVIDMAAHMQKACPPGGVAISDASAMHLPGGAAGVGTERVKVDDTTATIWSPRSMPPSP